MLGMKNVLLCTKDAQNTGGKVRLTRGPLENTDTTSRCKLTKYHTKIKRKDRLGTFKEKRSVSNERKRFVIFFCIGDFGESNGDGIDDRLLGFCI